MLGTRLLRCWKLSDHEPAAYLEGVRQAAWKGELCKSMAGQVGEVQKPPPKEGAGSGEEGGGGDGGTTPGSYV